MTIAEARRDFAAAAALLETIMARNRGNEDPEESGNNDRVFLVHLGFAYQQQGTLRRGGGARSAARRGLAAEPRTPSCSATTPRRCYLAKDLDPALAETRAARERFPKDPDLASLEATILREKGDTPGGPRPRGHDARERSPDDPQGAGPGGGLLPEGAALLGSRGSAPPRAARSTPKDLGTLFQLGAVLERQKKSDEAEAVFRDALQLQPDSAPVLNYLGYMNADRNVRVEEALALIEKAVALDPENGAYLDSLGWALYRSNRLDAAEQIVRKALAKQADNAVILDHLGDILKARGRVSEALQSWQKALEGEDEEGELDRGQVERKIREGKAALAAQQQSR